MNQIVAVNEKATMLYSLMDESRLLLRLYADIGSANFWQGFVEELSSLAKIHSAALVLSRSDRWEVLGFWTWNLNLDDFGRYMTEELAAQDELMVHVNRAKPGHFYSAGLYLSSPQGGPVYNSWIEPMGFQDVAIARVPSEHSTTGMAFYRTPEQGHFSHQELQQFDRLVPHIARALQLHCELVQQHDIGDLQGWLSLIKVPVLLFDENFQCRDQNAAARALFAAQKDIQLSKGFLEFEDASVTNRVNFEIVRTIKAALGQLDNKMTRLELMVNGEPLNLFFLPVEDAGESEVTSAGALVFIHQQSGQAELDLSGLKSGFGLTEAELALCSKLIRGLSLAEIAEQQGKSRETVRTQPKSIFAKTGINSQAELVASLLTHPLVIASLH